VTPDLLLSNLFEFVTAHGLVPGTSANIPVMIEFDPTSDIRRSHHPPEAHRKSRAGYGGSQIRREGGGLGCRAAIAFNLVGALRFRAHVDLDQGHSQHGDAYLFMFIKCQILGAHARARWCARTISRASRMNKSWLADTLDIWLIIGGGLVFVRGCQGI
jgi:hypothetical protein